MKNLTPQLQAIVARSQDPLDTISLREALAGEKITVILGEESVKSVIVFCIKKPAGPGWREYATETIIEECSFPSDFETWFRHFELPFPPTGKKAFIVGSCTKNLSAYPMGCSMISVHKITRGRHFIWAMPYGNRNENKKVTWIFPEVITNIFRQNP